MAARPTWKGAIRLSLISIPIRVFPASSTSSDVAFHQLHRRCHTPIQMKRWCPHCNEEVSKDDIVRGYEVHKGEFVLVEDEEIKKVKPKATHVVEVAEVVSADVIEPMYIERPYYLAPDSEQAGAPFAVIRESLEGRAAIGRLAMYGREYLVAVMPREKGLVMYTLRHGEEIRKMSDITELEYADVKTRPDEVRLARQVLGSFETGGDLSRYQDNYKKALKDLIAKHVGRHEAINVAQPAQRGEKVVNLMDALRQSLEKAGGKRKAAKATTHHHQPAEKRKRAS